MKTFKKFLEECETINEAEYNKEWWDSKSDSFKKRYIERHPNSIYAQNAKSQPAKKDSKPLSKGREKVHGKDSPEEKKDNSFGGSLFGRNKEKDTSYKEMPKGGFFAMSKKDQKDSEADFERLDNLEDKANRIKPKGENRYVISPKTLGKLNKEIGEFKKVQVPDGRTFYIGNYKHGAEKELANEVMSGKKLPDGMVIQMGNWKDNQRVLGFTNPKSAKSWFGRDYTREENKLKQGDSYYKELSKKFPVGKTVNPDSPSIPDDVIIDDDGVIIGYSK